MQSRGAAARLGLARNPGGVVAEAGAAAIQGVRSGTRCANKTALLVCDMTCELIGVLPKQSQTRLITSVNDAVKAAAHRGAAVIFTRIGTPAAALGSGAGSGRMPSTLTAAPTAESTFGAGPAVPTNNTTDLLTFDLHASKNKLLVQLRSMGFLDPESAGSQLHKDLIIPAGSVEIQKPRLSAFCGTALDRMLRGNNVEAVAVVGISSSGAVLSATRDAADLDYQVTVLSDATANPNGKVHSALLQHVLPVTAEVVSSKEWIATL